MTHNDYFNINAQNVACIYNADQFTKTHFFM